MTVIYVVLEAYRDLSFKPVRAFPTEEYANAFILWCRTENHAVSYDRWAHTHYSIREVEFLEVWVS